METNLYRKYRPNTFDQVVGQQVVVRTLINSIKNNTIAHAYLFSGVRGTGKTSIAKIFARAINCDNNLNPLCGECEICDDFASSSEVPDIFEIDAASNNGVEEIRKIIDNVKYMPMRLKYKVYIIDEVHMLSKGAFNALLKTLEEPPAHVIFILATTEPNKIPVTILSRVQRFDFGRIDDGLMLDHLIKVLDLEQINYETEALELIVSHAQGGLRDALSLLTKVISFDSDVTIATVTESLNLTSKAITSDLLDNIINHESEAVSSNYRQLIGAGADEAYLIQDLTSAARTRLIDSLATGDDNQSSYTKIITKLMETLAKLKIISNSSLYVEIVLIELSLKPKTQVALQPVVAPVTKPKVSEEDKLSNLQKQAELLKQVASEEVKQKPASKPVAEHDVEDQIDILFSNKTGKDVSHLVEPVKQSIEDPMVEEIGEEPMVEEVAEEPAVLESIATATYNSKPEKQITTPKPEFKLDPKLANLTIIDTLKAATKQDKQKAIIAARQASDDLNRNKQYGIAKFFEVSTVQGASSSGVVVSVDQNFYSTYESRLDQITHIYSNKIGSSVKVHLLTTQYWRQERMNFVRAVKENMEVDIYQDALDFFGKDIVNKVNT